MSIVLKGLIVILVSLVVTLVAILYSTDFNSYKGEIASIVRDATGRELVIEGDFAPKIGLIPAVAVSGVRLANAPWGSRKEMVRVDRMLAEIELLPILFGDIRIRQIVLSGVDILLEMRADGTGNWVMRPEAPSGASAAPSGPDGAPAVPSVDRVLIENSIVVWRDGRTGKQATMKIEKLQATADSSDRRLDVALRGRYNDSAIVLNGHLGALDSALRGGALPIDLKAEAGGAKIALKGSIGQPLQGKGVDLSATAEGNDLSAFRSLAGADVPSLGPYRLSATLQDRDRSWQFKGVALSVGQSDLNGTVSIDLESEPPAVAANLTSSLLRLQDFRDRKASMSGIRASQSAAPEAVRSADAGRVFPADPIPFDVLKTIDAKVSLRAQRTETDDIVLQDVTIEATLRKGRLAIRSAEAAVSGGRAAIDLDLDASRAVPSVAIKSRITNLDVSALASRIGREGLIEGRLGATATLSGSGRSVRAIMAGLDGTIDVTMEKGRLDDALIDLLSADVVKVIAPLSSGDEGIMINCLVGRYEAKAGKLVSRVTLFDTDRLVATGEGGIDLASERIDFLIDPKAKETSLMKLVVPLRVGGTLASPAVYPDPGGVVKGALGIAAGVATGGISTLVGAVLSRAASAGDNNPCLAALSAGASGKNGSSAKTPADDGSSSPTQEIERTLEDIGKGISEGLKGLLGQ